MRYTETELQAMIKDVWDTIKESNGCYISELVRKTGYSIEEVTYVLGYLHLERGQLDMGLVPTSDGYQNYRVFNILGDDVRSKSRIISKLIYIGWHTSTRFESALGTACRQVFGKNMIRATKYTSPDPDVLVPSKKLAIEISTRVIKPIDEAYIDKKLKYLDDNWSVLIIAPRISKSLKWYVRTLRDKQGKRIFVREYPKNIGYDTVPIFRTLAKPSKMYPLSKYLDRVGRDYSVVYYKDVVNDLKKIVQKFSVEMDRIG